MPERSALRVVIAGGGTGGHLFPGIAVARELKRRSAAIQVTFVGTAHGIEARVLPREGFELDLISSAGLKGKSIAARGRGLVLLPAGLAGAWRIVSRRRPHLVIGVGGYSSGPVVLVAALRGIPTMVLEQNALPGLTNRLLAPVVRSAAVTYDSTRKFFGAKAFHSGNPIRPEFRDAADRARSSRDLSARVGVLVFGGSQGAHAINLAMVAAAPKLAAAGLRLTHQTGERDLEMVRTAYRQAALTADVQPFLEDMGARLCDADLVVSRAGATTIAEITAAGKPAILIPLPSTDDHQRKNAELLASAGAADVLPQEEASAVLGDRILALAGDPSRRERMGTAARGQARPDAAAIIVDRALALVGRSTSSAV